MDEIERLGVKIGDWVEVERGGDVIPKVTRVVEDKDHPRGHKILSHAGTLPGVRWPCRPHRRRSRSSLRQRQLSGEAAGNAFCTLPRAGVMNIDGMGDALVNQLTDRGLVKNVADIYKLTKEDLFESRAHGRKICSKRARRNRSL